MGRGREEESRAVTYSRVVAAARWCWKQRRLQQRLSSRDDEEQYRYSRVRGGFLSGASSKLNLNAIGGPYLGEKRNLFLVSCFTVDFLCLHTLGRPRQLWP